jgi:uncharacterized protein (DUF433 family)
MVSICWLASDIVLDHGMKERGKLTAEAQHRIARKEDCVATLHWSQCSAVESIPGKVSGAWVFKGTRMPVSLVFENLEAGATIEDIMEWFHLTREQIVTVLEFAARSLDAPPISPQSGTSTLHADPL